MAESSEHRPDGTRSHSDPGDPSVAGFATRAFSVEEETLDDGTRLLLVGGELDVATAPVLGTRIRRPLFWDGVTRVIVDLSGLEFVDSSGVRALLLSRGHARALGTQLVFVCPEGGALRRLRLYGLDSVLEVFPTRDEALRARHAD
jgi:anti-sigma B factor antagonist